MTLVFFVVSIHSAI